MLSKSSKTKSLSVKTVRNKLRSVEYFCTYVIEFLSSAGNGDGSAKLIENVTTLQKSLPLWRKSLSGKCTLEDVKRWVQDGTEQILPQDITGYLYSEYAQYAEFHLDGLLKLSTNIRVPLGSVNSLGWKPSTRDFTRARNHLNAAARLIFSARRSNHITPLLHNLHWLRVPQRIQF